MTAVHPHQRRDATRRPVELFADVDEATALDWGSATTTFAISRSFECALRPADIEQFLDCSLLHLPFFKMVLDGVVVPGPQITSPRSVGGQRVAGMIDGAKVRNVISRGGTLMLRNMQEWHVPCRELCDSVTRTLAAEARSTAFYSPAGQQGLATHRDDAHVFVAQLAGAKQWTVFGVSTDPSSRRAGHAELAEGDRGQTVTLQPGDGLYVPPWAAHHATALPSSDSLHLSVHIREPRVREVLDVAIDEALSAEAQQAEIVGSATERTVQVAAMLQRVAQRLIELDPEDLVEAIEQRIVGR